MLRLVYCVVHMSVIWESHLYRLSKDCFHTLFLNGGTTSRALSKLRQPAFRKLLKTQLFHEHCLPKQLFSFLLLSLVTSTLFSPVCTPIHSLSIALHCTRSLGAANNVISFCFSISHLPLSPFSLFPYTIFSSFLCCTTLTLSSIPSYHFSPNLIHFTSFLFHSVLLPAPFGRDSSNRFSGAGRANQRAPPSR